MEGMVMEKRKRGRRNLQLLDKIEIYTNKDYKATGGGGHIN